VACGLLEGVGEQAGADAAASFGPGDQVAGLGDVPGHGWEVAAQEVAPHGHAVAAGRVHPTSADPALDEHVPDRLAARRVRATCGDNVEVDLEQRLDVRRFGVDDVDVWGSGAVTPQLTIRSGTRDHGKAWQPSRWSFGS